MALPTLTSRWKTSLEADKPETIAEVVDWYDRNLKRTGARVAALNSEQLATSLNFMGVFNLLAFAYLGFLSNHGIHHRGQLATYRVRWDRSARRFMAQ